MNIVTPAASFTLNIIPKHKAEILDSCVLLNKMTNTETTLVLDTTVVYYDCGYYVELDATHTMAEDEFYRVTVYDDQGNLSYIGSVFCTSQTDYSINSGKYTENTTTNEYITR